MAAAFDNCRGFGFARALQVGLKDSWGRAHSIQFMLILRPAGLTLETKVPQTSSRVWAIPGHGAGSPSRWALLPWDGMDALPCGDCRALCLSAVSLPPEAREAAQGLWEVGDMKPRSLAFWQQGWEPSACPGLPGSSSPLSCPPSPFRPRDFTTKRRGRHPQRGAKACP